MDFVIGIAVLLFFIYYLYELRQTKFEVKKMMVVALFSAIAFILSNITFLKMPNGGSIAFVSFLPTLFIGLMYGRGYGMTSGLILGVIKMINGIFYLNPVQFALDYLVCNMVLGLVDHKAKNKWYLVASALMVVAFSVMVNVVSGAVYFGEYAPEGMNAWVYSFIYNFGSVGVDGLLSVIALSIIPLTTIKKLQY